MLVIVSMGNIECSLEGTSRRHQPIHVDKYL
jgi:hypothetical protein